MLQEAIANESYYDDRCAYWEKGSIDQGFKESNRSINGSLRIGGQDHFYLETHCCRAIPLNEHNEIEIISATQSPSELQVYTTKIIINKNKVKWLFFKMKYTI